MVRRRITRHQKTIHRSRTAEIWECSCGFMTWRARRPQDDRLARRLVLDASWNRHLNRRRLRRVK